MSTLWGSRTQENLKAAFADGSQTQRRYAYFAAIAEAEGHPEIASGFWAAAERAAAHARCDLDFLRQVGDPATDQPIGDTAQNLRSIIAGEAVGAEGRYAEYARVARAEGFPEIAGWFEELAEAEESNAARFRELLAGVAAP